MTPKKQRQIEMTPGSTPTVLKAKLPKKTAVAAPEKETKEVPSYFLSISVENVRCFGPEQTLNLSDGEGRPARWTVLLGDNGVGKTTLLQCLCGLQEGANAPRTRTMSPGFLRMQGKDKWVRSPLEFLREGTDTARINVTTTSGEGPLSLIQAGLPVSPVRFEVLFHDMIEWRMKLRFDEKSYPLLPCFGYGAGRQSSITSIAESESVEPSASLFDEKADLINAEEWLLRADHSSRLGSGASESARHQGNVVKSLLIDLLPDVSDIRIVKPEDTFRGSNPRVLFKTPYGWVTLSQLSLGYRCLIAWMVDLAYRLFLKYPKSKNPLAEPAVVLVDEIDLHLHPTWQRKLMGYLTDKFPNAQFIVTAHSPLVVQAASGANIVLLKREGDHVVIENRSEAIRGWRVDQILTSDLFGLPTARPPEYDEAIKRREALLSKKRRTKKENEELEELNETVESLPLGDTAADREAMDIIRRAAATIKKRENGGA